MRKFVIGQVLLALTFVSCLPVIAAQVSVEVIKGEGVDESEVRNALIDDRSNNGRTLNAVIRAAR